MRIVCATNRDLRAASQCGEFRADVWYRLSGVVVEVAPLRERLEDIVAYLKTQRLGGVSAYDALSPAALEVVATHPWDGNFRELRNFIERLPGGVLRRHRRRALCRRALAQGFARAQHVQPRRQSGRPPRTRPGRSWRGAPPTRSRPITPARSPAAGTRSKNISRSDLKPLLFTQLAGIDSTTAREHIDLQQVARRLDADRGTAIKQIARYFECYGERSG